MKILACLYVVPLFRFLFGLFGRLKYRPWLRAVNLHIGRLEWGAHLFRDSIGLAVWLYLLCFNGYLNLMVAIGRASDPSTWDWSERFLSLFFILMSVWVWMDVRRHKVRMLDFALLHRPLDPREFFGGFFAGFGPLPLDLPASPRLLSVPVINFRRGGPARLRLWPTIHGAFSTYFIASLVLLANRVLPRYSAGSEDDRLPRAVDSLMEIWGARAIQLGRLRVVMEGHENLRGVRGQCLLCFNHKSTLDFAVAAAALGLAELANRGPFRIRYLAARDHFLDNWLLYRVIGIGRAIEAAGMVFVHRKGSHEQRRKAVEEAVAKIVSSGVDVAIFPQGTRAPGNIARDGERLDSGYFTSGGARRLAEFGKHLKKGAAHLAVDAAWKLTDLPPLTLRGGERGSYDGAHSRPFYVIPIALIGTGVALPKRGIRVQTETEIKMVVGEPRIVAVDVLTNTSVLVGSVHDYIDRQLEELSGVRNVLATRFLTDIRRFMPQEEVEVVAAALNNWKGEQRLIFAILDCIYANPPAAWQPWLHALASDISQGEPHEFLEMLYKEVVKGLK